MSNRLLRATVRFKWLFNRLCSRSVMVFEYIIYFVCCFFLCALTSAILYNVILLVIEDDVLKLYIMGIMIAIGIALSITYITRFNKKSELFPMFMGRLTFVVISYIKTHFVLTFIINISFVLN